MAFFQEIRNSPLNKKQIEKIHQLSEGWVGGLILLCEHLDRLPPGERDGSLGRIPGGRFKEQVFEYFESEIFNTQPVAY